MRKREELIQRILNSDNPEGSEPTAAENIGHRNRT